MSVLSILSFIAFIIYMYIGVSIYKDNRYIIEHKLLLMLCLSFAIWSLPFVFIYPGQDIYLREFLLKVSEIGGCSFSAILLHLIFIIYKRRFIEINLHKNLIYVPLIILIIIRWGYFGVENTGSGVYAVYQTIQKIYNIIYLAIGAILGCKYFQKSMILREKKVIRVLMITGIITLLMRMIYVVLEAVFIANKLPNIYHLFSIVWIITMWYCFKRYSFLNVQDVLKAEIIFDKLKDMIIVLDCNGYIVSINLEVLRLTSFNKQDIIGQPIYRFIEGLNINYDLISKSTDLELVRQGENKLITKNKEFIPISFSVTRVLDNLGQIVGAIIVAQDIRIVKKLEREIEENLKVQRELSYLSYHDSLTGLYNRTSFENRMRQLEPDNSKQSGIIICDVDGLKLINDTLGHKDGDKLIKLAASVISNSIGEKHLVARIGGDEFAIIADNISVTEIECMYSNIQRAVEEYNSMSPKLPLSMSIGYAVKTKDTTMKDVFKEADNNMYREKLLQSHNTKEEIVKALTKALKLKDFILQGHSERLFELMISMANIIDLPDYKVNNLWLIAQFHDIGKVGIPDSILFKPGALNLEEFSELKRHCEIGYRIAKSSPELEPVAEYILKHHEWWDGCGYPLGLKGEEIPIECRIFSIADAFDVMTTERPYNNVLSIDEAISEILRCSGRQFDPELALKFVELIRSKERIRA